MSLAVAKFVQSANPAVNKHDIRRKTWECNRYTVNLGSYQGEDPYSSAMLMQASRHELSALNS